VIKHHKLSSEIVKETHNFKMTTSTLNSVFEDIADSDIPKKEFLVKVVKQISSTEFEIADDSGKAVLRFLEDAVKRAYNLELNKVIKLFGIQKLSSTTLSFTKNSFWIEDKSKSLRVESESAKLQLKDLCNLKPGDIVRDKITLKVFEVKPAAKTVKGTEYMKVVFADEDFTTRATFWRGDIDKWENILEVGSVYEISNFALDKYPLDTNGKKPKDINIRSSTILRKLEGKNIPRTLLDLSIPEEISGKKGTIKFITSVHSYSACPGNGGPCGKSVRDNKVCEKCGVNISSVTLVNAYKCDLVFFSSDDVIYHVTSFSSQLKEFEKEGETVEEKLANILSKPVSVKMFEKDDGYMLIKLVIPN
jgi:hypothetical protein